MPSNPAKSPMPRLIAMLCYEDAQILDIAGPLEVFDRASRWLEDHRGSTQAYRVIAVAKRAGELRLSNGLSLTMKPLYASEGADTLMITGGIGIGAAASDPELLEWVKATATRVPRVAGVCTGSILMARAGLLENKAATTHWAYLDQLQESEPSCKVNRSAIFVRDGPIITSAGVTAGMDMALALVEEDHGKALALHVAQELVMYLRRPGDQRQFSRHIQTEFQDNPFVALERWVIDRLPDDLSVTILARQVGQSERQFYRNFRNQMGCSPAVWVRMLRVEEARRQLERGARSLKIVARRCGFRDEQTLRRAFRSEVNITPSEYLERFS